MDDFLSPTPSSSAPTLSLSPSFFDMLRPADEDSNFDLAMSPGSRRCPTYKEYYEKFRKLTNENFNLRVRVFLAEHKASKSGASSAELAALYKKFLNFNQLQSGSGDNENDHPFLSPSNSTLQIFPSNTSVTNELERVTTDKAELEAKLKAYEEILTERDQKIVELASKNGELSRKNEEISTQLQKLSEDLAGRRDSEQELEKLASFAFGENNEVVLLNAEWESKLQEKSHEIIELEAELQTTKKKFESSDKRVGGLKTEIKEYERRVLGMAEALKEMGRKCARAERDNGKLRKLTEKANDNMDELSISPNPDKFSAIKHLVAMLQGRMKELTNFVETLLQLESKKVFTLTGLTDENRDNLFKAIEQCRMYSKTLDQLFEKDYSSHHYSSANTFNFNVESHGRSHGHHHHRHRHHSSTESQYPTIFSPFERARQKTSEVQCNILESSLVNSVESANAYINRLKQDIASLENINGQLAVEKADLMTQVKSLESNMNILRMTNHVDKSAIAGESNHNGKLKEENRSLLERLGVTEDALRNLHVQHAKLVGELKLLRSIHQKSSKTSVGSTVVESNRPVDSTSPDLGIDSGHDGAVNSDDSNSTNYKEENRILRTTNRELALKLKQTRQALDITLEKLNSTTKEKEQVEKAICRQLHKTHTILRQAKKSVEKFTNSQCQENIMPSPS